MRPPPILATFRQQQSVSQRYALSEPTGDSVILIICLIFAMCPFQFQ